MAIDIYGRPEGGIPDLKEIGTPKDNKEHTWARWTPLLTYVADVQLCLHMGPHQLGWARPKKAVACSWDTSF